MHGCGGDGCVCRAVTSRSQRHKEPLLVFLKVAKVRLKRRKIKARNVKEIKKYWKRKEQMARPNLRKVLGGEV